MILETYKDLLSHLANLSEEKLDMNISIQIDGEHISGASGLIRLVASNDDVLDHDHPLIEVAAGSRPCSNSYT